MSDRHKELHEENEQLRRDLAAAQTHLRKIVEAADKHGCGGPVRDAIQAAKEELNK